MTVLPPDPYKALGLTKDAQIAEIRSAYRKLVLRCHPDKVQDPALKAQKADEFQKVQQAYEILNDDKERQRYDDQVRLAELRKQMQAKANSSAPRATAAAYKYTAEPRPSTFKTGSPPSAKTYTYSRSWEEGGSPRTFEAEIRTVRRESSYSDKPSKRESERDRDRREKDKERDRRKKAEDAIRRAEKEAKEARKADKKAREKAEEKERRRENEEKKRRNQQPYIEPLDEEVPVKSEKKRSSKKHEEKRDRSSHREEIPVSSMPPPPMPPMPQERSYTSKDKEDYAASYIEAARAKKSTAYSRNMAPPAPTPPPAPGQSSPFQPPAAGDEEDVRRSSGKSRRGSSGEKAYHKKSSREVLIDEANVVDVSPSARQAQKSAMAAAMSGSPPRLGRQNTMPADAFTRPMPTMPRATTFSGAYPDASDPRGRSRSRLQPQIEESDSEEDYDRKHRKHRSSKKHRSPEPRSSEYVKSYKVDNGRTTLHSSYSRSLEQPADSFSYYPPGTHGIRVEESRPSMPIRESSYSRSAGSYAKFPKIKTSKAYDFEDVSYSQYPSYQDEYAY